MSCMRKQVVLRIPASCVGVHDQKTYDDFECKHPGLLYYEAGCLSYSLATCGEKRYFDYILYDSPLPHLSSLDSCSKARLLSGREKRKYLHVFRRLSPAVNMNDVRYCEYVWYDGTEAPDCYHELHETR